MSYDLDRAWTLIQKAQDHKENRVLLRVDDAYQDWPEDGKTALRTIRRGARVVGVYNWLADPTDILNDIAAMEAA